MITYNTSDDNFIEETTDMANKNCHIFLIDNNIHIVYNLNNDNQHSSFEDLDKIINNMDDFLFTPYAKVALKLSKN